MRIILRVGLIVGAMGLVALYALQIVAALLVAPAIILLGVIVGLCMAKWLERGWYGRQFAAGARAGALACALAATGGALFLLLQGPHSLATLLARSRLGPLTLAPALTPFDYLGWAGLDVGAALVALLAGILAAGLTTQVAAASKSRRALRVVEQARLVAQSLNRTDTWAAPVSGGRATAGPAMFGAAANPSAGPALGPSLSALWPTAAPPSGTLGMGATPGASSSSTHGPALGMPSFPSAAGAAGAAWGVRSRPIGTPAAQPTPAPRVPQSPPSVAGVPGATFGGAGLTPLAPTPPPPLTQQPTGGRWAGAKQPPQAGANAASAGPGVSGAPATPSGAGSPTRTNTGAPGRVPSSARAADSALTDEQRQALAAWANNPSIAERQPRPRRDAGSAGASNANPPADAAPTEPGATAGGGEDGADAGQHRPPKPSTYLNSDPPAPKRTRKKQNTRDWLC